MLRAWFIVHAGAIGHCRRTFFQRASNFLIAISCVAGAGKLEPPQLLGFNDRPRIRLTKNDFSLQEARVPSSNVQNVLSLLRENEPVRRSRTDEQFFGGGSQKRVGPNCKSRRHKGERYIFILAIGHRANQIFSGSNRCYFGDWTLHVVADDIEVAYSRKDRASCLCGARCTHIFGNPVCPGATGRLSSAEAAKERGKFGIARGSKTVCHGHLGATTNKPTRT